MEELQLLERAKGYLELLSKGIDPVSGEEIPGDGALNNERLKRCFAYVCGVLQKVINNQGKVVNVVVKQPFYISENQLRGVSISGEPVTSAELVKRVNLFIDGGVMKRLTSAPINRWLTENNYLQEEKIAVKAFKSVRKLTPLSESLGISSRQVIVKSTGEVKEEIVFSPAAQRFILEHINQIAGGAEGDTKGETE